MQNGLRPTAGPLRLVTRVLFQYVRVWAGDDTVECRYIVFDAGPDAHCPPHLLGAVGASAGVLRNFLHGHPRFEGVCVADDCVHLVGGHLPQRRQ